MNAKGTTCLIDLLRINSRFVLSAILALVTLATAADAQPSYTLEVVNEPYESLAGTGESLPIPWGDWSQDDAVFLSPPGMTLRLFGESYPLDLPNGIGISRYGTLYVPGEMFAVIIDLFFTNLDSTSNDVEVRYSVESLGNDTVLAIEWSNAGFEGCAAEFGATFQVRLYERTGVIELHYGEIRDGCGGAYYDGTSTGPFVGLSRGNMDFSNVYEMFRLQDNAANPAVTSSGYPALDGAPPTGTLYRFTPTETSAVSDGLDTPLPVRVVPNPISERGVLEFTIGSSTNVRFGLYDALGRLLRSILDERLEAGNHAVAIDMRDLPSGTYLVKGAIGDREVTVPVVAP